MSTDYLVKETEQLLTYSNDFKGVKFVVTIKHGLLNLKLTDITDVSLFHTIEQMAKYPNYKTAAWLNNKFDSLILSRINLFLRQRNTYCIYDLDTVFWRHCCTLNSMINRGTIR